MTTFVLVHGGSHGGWCWQRVAGRLRERGADVVTPTLTGAGERVGQLASASIAVYVDDVVGVLEAGGLTDVVLVGHSLGALAVTGVADRVPERLRAVVFLDGLLVEDGRTVFDAMPEPIVRGRRAAAVDVDGVSCLPWTPASAFGVTDPTDAAWLESRLTPQPLGLYDEPVHWANPIGNGLPCHYIAMTDPPYPPLGSSRAYARAQPGWTWHEIATGHDAMITEPGQVAEALWEVAAGGSPDRRATSRSV